MFKMAGRTSSREAQLQPPAPQILSASRTLVFANCGNSSVASPADDDDGDDDNGDVGFLFFLRTF